MSTPHVGVFGLALGVLLGLAGGFLAGRAWERYAYEMIGARARLSLAREYAGGAFRAVLLVAAVAAVAGLGLWATRDSAPAAPAPAPTRSASSSTAR